MSHLNGIACFRAVGSSLCVMLLFASSGIHNVWAQSGPPENPSNYSLVWEDYFATDPQNAGGELQNIVGSSSNPLRPDWMYRNGTVGQCALGQLTNVYLGNTTQLSGLLLHDTASGSDGLGNYLTYNCGGIITTRWMQYGYYETKAYIGTSTSYVGFHTSFWLSGQGSTNQPVSNTELDIFENDSHGQDQSYGGFSHGLYYHNIKSTDAIPSPHGSYKWSNLLPANSYSVPHIFGFLWMPSGIKFYLDGAPFVADQAQYPATGQYTSGTIPATGSFAPQNIWLTSVGSTNNAETGNCSAHTGPCLPISDPSSYDFIFEYVKYYQPLLSVQPIVPIPSSAILIDPNAPPSGTTSFSHSGGWQPYIANLPVAGSTTNSNVKYGPQGFLGQDVWTSTTAGDTTVWSHTFSAADAGSYDLYVWNTTAHRFELATSTPSSPQLAYDSAALTSYTVQDVYGSTTTDLASLVIPQGTTAQGWASLTSDMHPHDNTYAFNDGHTATITLTVGNEAADPTQHVYPHTNAESVAFVPVRTFGVTGLASPDSYTDTGFSTSSLTGWSGSTSSRYSTVKSSSASAVWTSTVPGTGVYTVFAWVPQDPNGNSSTAAFYNVSDGSNTQTFGPFNQQSVANQWIQIGNFTSTSTTITTTITNGNSTVPANGYLRTNALKLTAHVSADYIVCTDSFGFDNAALFSQSAGAWSSSDGGYSGCGQEQTSSSPNASAVFTLQVPVGGFYHAYLYNNSALAASSRVTITSHSSVNAVCSGLVKSGSNNWIYLGDYYFAPDIFKINQATTTSDRITVASTGGAVAVSAVKLTYASERGTRSNECTNN